MLIIQIVVAVAMWVAPLPPHPELVYGLTGETEWDILYVSGDLVP